MSFLGQKITTLREAQGLSQRALAKKAGIAHVTLQKIESGQTPNPGAITLNSIATALDISPEALLSRKILSIPEASTRPVVSRPDGFYRFPCKGVVSASSLTMQSQPEDIVYYEWHGLDEYSSDLFCLEVRGNSMYPPVPDRAVLLVRPTKAFRHGGWYVVHTTEGLSTFKVLEFNSTQGVLKPLNPEHQPIRLGQFDISQVFEVIEVKFRP